MTRLHADPVEVRTASAPDGPVPEQFLWRGRLYLVREVLARWTASGPWWRTIQQSAIQQSATESGLQEGDEQWWRVEADSGRLAALSGGRGTYDLCFSWRTGWSLTRVLD
jgi:hypothetical protein